MMKNNVGNLDKVVRILLGAALVVYAVLGTGPYHLAGYLGVILLATAFVGWCPIYRVLGMNSCPVK